MINSFLLLLLFSTLNFYAQTPKGGLVAKFDLLSREAFKEETPVSMIETYFELKKEMTAESIYKDFSLRAYISKDGTKGTVTGYFANVLGFAAHPKVKKLKIGYNDYKKQIFKINMIQ